MENSVCLTSLLISEATFAFGKLRKEFVCVFFYTLFLVVGFLDCNDDWVMLLLFSWHKANRRLARHDVSWVRGPATTWFSLLFYVCRLIFTLWNRPRTWAEKTASVGI
jgi:hypothetical protein